jgi:hypothetical protein
MLKRFSHIGLSLLLLVSTMGFAVSKHYCGDALVDVAYNKNADACCDTGSCCHNETQVFQLDEDFSVPQIANAPDLQEIAIFGFALFTIDQTPSEHLEETFYQNNSPPPLTVNEALSLRQVFLL